MTNHTPEVASGPRLHALIVTIDRYKDRKIPDLKGCTVDGDNMERFLVDTFPSRQIRRLANEDATRSAILDAFDTQFTTNSGVQKGDPMLFFFAGHGSRVKPHDDWHTETDEVEALVPYDQGSSENSVVYGIPYLTLRRLVQKLASVKGNNIVRVRKPILGRTLNRNIYR